MYNRATTTRHNYSIWQPPGNLKVKISDSTVHFFRYKHFFGGRRGGLIVSALVSGSSGPGSSPGRGHCVVFLGKTLYSHSIIGFINSVAPSFCI